MKIVKPKITNITKKDIKSCFATQEFFEAEVENETPTNLTISDINIDSCSFKNVDFSNISLASVDILDSIFEDCDLSNQNFNKQFIDRVIFKNCKLVGTTFVDSNIRNVQFILEETIFEGSEFAGATLKNVDFTTCNINGAIFDQKSLKNIIVNNFQAASIATMFGVIVKD